MPIIKTEKTREEVTKDVVEIRALIAKADELGVKAKSEVIEEQVAEAEVKLPTTDIK